MVFDDDYLQRDRYYREHILGGDDDEDDGYDDEAGETASMQRVWRDYHVLGYAEDDGDDRQSQPRAARQKRTESPGEIRFQPMSQKYREEYAKKQEENEAARIIRTNRAVCIAAAAAVLISLLLILL